MSAPAETPVVETATPAEPAAAAAEAKITAAAATPMDETPAPPPAETASAAAAAKATTETPPATAAANAAADVDKANVSPSKADSAVMSEAAQHLAAGKRNLAVEDVAAAVTSLEKACRLLGEHYGETAFECGEAYYHYGKALLELARMEDGVLGNALEGVPEGEDTDVSEIEDEDVSDAQLKQVKRDVNKALKENGKDLAEMKEMEVAEKDDSSAAAAVTVTTNGADAAAEKETAKEKAATGQNEAAKVDKTEEKAKSPVKKDSEDADKAEVAAATDESEEDGDESEGSEEKEEESESDAQEKAGAEDDKASAAGEDAKETGEDAKETGEDAKETGEDANAAGEDAKETESIASNEAGTSDAKETKDVSAIAKEDEEDPGNLQLAWEMLELAKTIFQRHADTLTAASDKRLELEKRIHETYQILGEVSIENEHYAQAIEDLTSCLRRRQELLPEDSRCIAETHYQMGVALGFAMDFDEAVRSLNSAIETLQLRIKNLEDKKESPDPSSKGDAFYTREKEIKEIQELIPEIKEKIKDTIDMKEEMLKKLGKERTGEEGKLEDTSSCGGGGTSSSPTSKPTSNISASLIKKRKKSDDAASSAAAADGDGTASPAKKAHITNGAPLDKTECGGAAVTTNDGEAAPAAAPAAVTSAPVAVNGTADHMDTNGDATA